MSRDDSTPKMPEPYRAMDELRSFVQNSRRSSYGNWIKFRGRCYSVCGCALDIFSETFSRYRTPGTNSPYEIKANVCEESVIEFMKPFQNENPNLTTSILDDVLSLCEEFEIKCFHEAALELIGIDKHEAIIGGIKRSMEQNCVTKFLEAHVREHFLDFIDNDQLFELSPTCLARVAALPTSPTADQIDKYIDFIAKSLDHFGPAASILLKAIDSNQLSFSQIYRLMQRPYIQWGFLGDLSTLPITTCVHSHAELRQQIASINQQIASIQKENLQLRSDREIMKNDIQETKNDIEKFSSDVQTDLDDLRSQVDQRAILSMVEKLQFHLDIEIDATKSDIDYVKRICAGEPELKWRCAEILKDSGFSIVPFDEESPLNGIIRYLQESSEGSVYAQGLVDVTASPADRTANNGNNFAENVVDLGTDSCFTTGVSPIQWICLEFKRHHVKVSHYSIRTFDGQPGEAHLKSWIVDGSQDGQNWIDLDERRDNDQLNCSNAVASFEVTRSALCRFIRIRQAGVNHSGNHRIALSAFELFGSILG
jgi:hypothetical protein